VPTPATITAEELAALIAERDALAGALRVATTARDLALERLRSLQRQLFAAKSEARGTDQKNLFLNEAEALAPADHTPQAETDEDESTPVDGHQRKKRTSFSLNTVACLHRHVSAKRRDFRPRLRSLSNIPRWEGRSSVSRQ